MLVSYTSSQYYRFFDQELKKGAFIALLKITYKCSIFNKAVLEVQFRRLTLPLSPVVTVEVVVECREMLFNCLFQCPLLIGENDTRAVVMRLH